MPIFVKSSSTSRLPSIVTVLLSSVIRLSVSVSLSDHLERYPTVPLPSIPPMSLSTSAPVIYFTVPLSETRNLSISPVTFAIVSTLRLPPTVTVSPLSLTILSVSVSLSDHLERYPVVPLPSTLLTVLLSTYILTAFSVGTESSE